MQDAQDDLTGCLHGRYEKKKETAFNTYTYRSMGRFSRRWTDDIFFLFFLENKIWHFMQIVS